MFPVGLCLSVTNIMAISLRPGYEVVWGRRADHGPARSDQRVLVKTAPFPSGGGARPGTAGFLQEGTAGHILSCSDARRSRASGREQTVPSSE